MLGAVSGLEGDASPRFSVVICTYNRADALPGSAGSVLAQEFEDFELIIVDDGSTDDTEAVVSSLIEADARVRYVRRENGGLSRARNSGIEAARGRFVIFLDDDDRSEPEWLGVLDQHVGDALVVSCAASARS